MQQYNIHTARVCVCVCVPIGKMSTRPDMPLPPIPTETRASGGGRADMPLPPLPTSTSPPVPQRTPAVTPAPPPPGEPLSSSYPPLPPRNNSRANGGGSSPVPPQQSTPEPVARGAPPSSSAATRAQCRENSIMDLVTLGYSRSEVVRALSIARNDFNIAKGILMEFGGKI